MRITGFRGRYHFINPTDDTRCLHNVTVTFHDSLAQQRPDGTREPRLKNVALMVGDDDDLNASSVLTFVVLDLDELRQALDSAEVRYQQAYGMTPKNRYRTS